MTLPYFLRSFWGVGGAVPSSYYKNEDFKEVRMKLPHPFKCSKCEYIGKNKADLNQHWLDH
jgi:hypothetical protein